MFPLLSKSTWQSFDLRRGEVYIVRKQRPFTTPPKQKPKGKESKEMLVVLDMVKLCKLLFSVKANNCFVEFFLISSNVPEL
ncbi:hypothetical protein Trydic_g9357 [Trypoxylus dichotomus]